MTQTKKRVEYSNITCKGEPLKQRLNLRLIKQIPKLFLELSDGVFNMLLDAKKMAMVFVNLFNNAVEVMPKGYA